MKIQELIAKGAHKARGVGFREDEWIELPQPSPDGTISPNVLVVMDGSKAYFNVDAFDREEFEEIEGPDLNEHDLEERVDFKEAKEHQLRFGRPEYFGKTLDEIARTDEGLKYLDWLLSRGWLWKSTEKYIKAYLNNPVIKRELERIV